MGTLSFLGPLLLSACVDGILGKGNAIICNFESPPPVTKYYEPEKSCYIEGVFYPRCADYDNKLVKHYHDLLKRDHEKTFPPGCIPFEHTCFCSNGKSC